MSRFDVFATIYYAQGDQWKNKFCLRYLPFMMQQHWRIKTTCKCWNSPGQAQNTSYPDYRLLCLIVLHAHHASWQVARLSMWGVLWLQPCTPWKIGRHSLLNQTRYSLYFWLTVPASCNKKSLQKEGSTSSQLTSQSGITIFHTNEKLQILLHIYLST